MSFHKTAPCFLNFYRSDQSLLSFKFNFFKILVCLLFMLHFVVGMIMYGYNTVEHRVNNCTGANYCKALI